MTTNNLPAAEADEQPAAKPTTALAGELQVGDYVIAADVHPDASGVGEVIAVKKYGSANHPFVAVMISYGNRYEPDMACLLANQVVGLPTDAQILDAAANDHRETVAEQLRELANLIIDKKIPLPVIPYTTRVMFQFSRHVSQVEEVAAILGIAAEEKYGTTSVTWPAEDVELGLSAEWLAYTPKPKPVDVADEALVKVEAR